MNFEIKKAGVPVFKTGIGPVPPPYQLKNIFEKLQSYLLQLPKILAKSLVFFLLGT